MSGGNRIDCGPDFGSKVTDHSPLSVEPSARKELNTEHDEKNRQEQAHRMSQSKTTATRCHGGRARNHVNLGFEFMVMIPDQPIAPAEPAMKVTMSAHGPSTFWPAVPFLFVNFIDTETTLPASPAEVSIVNGERVRFPR